MINMSIECDVKACKYHHEVEGYCTRNYIRVAENQKDQYNTSDCASFEKR